MRAAASTPSEARGEGRSERRGASAAPESEKGRGEVQHNGVDDPTFWRIVKDVTGKSPPAGVAERRFKW